MKFKLALVALAAASSFSAQAGTIVLDDFSFAQAVNVVGSPSTVSAGTNFVSRVVSIAASTGGTASAFNPTITIGAVTLPSGTSGNFLQVNTNNSSGAVATVEWMFNSLVTGALANTATWSVLLNQVDLQGTVTVGGNMRVSPGNANGTSVSLADNTTRSTLNPFSVTFSAATNSDSTWSLFRLAYECKQDFTDTGRGCAGNAVPEPGTMALLGLGLLGAGALRRKIK